MSLLSEVKCSRCDRRYSGIRSRCPYCGARRSNKGKYGPEPGESKAKYIVGAVLIVLLLAAAAFLIVQSLRNKQAEAPDTTPKQSYSDDENITSVDGTKPVDTTPVTPTTPDSSVTPDKPDEPPTPQVQAEALAIMYLGEEKDDITMDSGTELELSAYVEPEDVEVTWSVDDESVAIVLQSGKVTAVGAGETTLRLSGGGMTAECILRVN